MAQDTKVEALDGGPVMEAFDKHEGLIEELERMLEQARSGEIVGLAGAVMHRDQATGVRVVGLSNRALLGALAVVQYTLAGDL